jgi:hypothetical protein
MQATKVITKKIAMILTARLARYFRSCNDII